MSLIGNIGRAVSFFSRKDAVSAPVSAPEQAFNPYYGIFASTAEVTPYYSWLLYKNVSTFAKVVDLIADQVAGLDPLFKVGDKPIVPDTPLRSFFDYPGFNRDRRKLIKELTVQFLVCGTAYPCVYGNINFDPVALDVLKAIHVTPVVAQDMWPGTYIYAEGTRSDQFYKMGGHDFRWVSNSQMSEIWPIYDMDGEKRGVGLSRLSAIKNEVELKLSGNEHNKNMLDNGARPSGALVFKDRITKEQRDNVQSKMKAELQGAPNAGRIMIFSGGEAEFLQLSQNAKDMDWANLVKMVDDAIVARYNVPITLFNVGAQTNNNYETAWNQFYDNAILPTFSIVWGGLARMLSARAQADIRVEHNTLTNNTLARQAAARAKELRTVGLITTNEARALVGYEPVLGGDALLAPAGEIPVGEDYFTETGAGGKPLSDPDEPRKLTDDRSSREKRVALS